MTAAPPSAISRRALPGAVAAALAALLGASIAHAQPVNDEPAAAASLADGLTVSGSTAAAAATPGLGELCGQSAEAPDVWFSYTPATTSEVTFSLCGSAFDTVMSLHQVNAPGQPGAALACNDDFTACPPGSASRIVRTLAAGSTVLVRVSGYGGEAGPFVIRITGGGGGAQPPVNDECAAALDIQQGDHAFSTALASDSAIGDHPGCQAFGSASMGDDIWFRFVQPVGGRLEADTCGSTFDTRIAVYAGEVCEGLDEPGRLLACNDDGACFASGAGGTGGAGGAGSASGVSVEVGFGQTLLVRVGGYLGASGGGTLHVRAVRVCPCDFNASGVLSVQDIYDFLTAFLGGSADFNRSGTTSVQDIYDFLTCFQAGCP